MGLGRSAIFCVSADASCEAVARRSGYTRSLALGAIQMLIQGTHGKIGFSSPFGEAQFFLAFDCRATNTHASEAPWLSQELGQGRPSTLAILEGPRIDTAPLQISGAPEPESWSSSLGNFPHSRVSAANHLPETVVAQDYVAQNLQLAIGWREGSRPPSVIIADHALGKQAGRRSTNRRGDTNTTLEKLDKRREP
jgi:hypothetical protein